MLLYPQGQGSSRDGSAGRIINCINFATIKVRMTDYRIRQAEREYATSGGFEALAEYVALQSRAGQIDPEIAEAFILQDFERIYQFCLRLTSQLQ